MPRYTGYDGADSETALIAALKEDFDGEEMDAIQKIKTKYMRDGHIIDIAVVRGYTEKQGFKGWVYTAIGKGETYARECLACWKGRSSFDDAVKWYRTGNTGFVPSNLSGPRFGAELLKAYGERLLTDADKLARKKPKTMTAKELRQQVAMYRGWLDRLAGEHVKWAEEDNRAPRVLHQITFERAAQENAENVEEVFPLHATRAASKPDGPEEEQHLGVDEGETQSPEQDLGGAEEGEVGQQQAGTGFTVVDQIVPPQRAARPQKPELQLVLPVEKPVETPVAHKLDTSMPTETLAEIEERVGLKGWRGAKPKTDAEARSRRAAFFQYCAQMSPAVMAYLSRQSRKWWLGMETDLQVIAALKVEQPQRDGD